MIMKKGILGIVLFAGLTSCGGFTEEQGNAAVDFCECMEKDAYGDFDINYFECDMEINNAYEPAVFGDEGYTDALEEKCPDVASQFTEAE